MRAVYRKVITAFCGRSKRLGKRDELDLDTYFLLDLSSKGFLQRFALAHLAAR